MTVTMGSKKLGTSIRQQLATQPGSIHSGTSSSGSNNVPSVVPDTREK